jgi:hypothetical protein
VFFFFMMPNPDKTEFSQEQEGKEEQVEANEQVVSIQVLLAGDKPKIKEALGVFKHMPSGAAKVQAAAHFAEHDPKTYGQLLIEEVQLLPPETQDDTLLRLSLNFTWAEKPLLVRSCSEETLEPLYKLLQEKLYSTVRSEYEAPAESEQSPDLHRTIEKRAQKSILNIGKGATMKSLFKAVGNPAVVGRFLSELNALMEKEGGLKRLQTEMDHFSSDEDAPLREALYALVIATLARAKAIRQAEQFIKDTPMPLEPKTQALLYLYKKTNNQKYIKEAREKVAKFKGYEDLSEPLRACVAILQLTRNEEDLSAALDKEQLKAIADLLPQESPLRKLAQGYSFL